MTKEKRQPPPKNRETRADGTPQKSPGRSDAAGSALSEAIDRATAAVGQDDGKR